MNEKRISQLFFNSDSGRMVGLKKFPMFLIIVIPFFLMYVWYIHQFGVNVPYWDEWSIIKIVTTPLKSLVNLPLLWSQHNENRMLFPNVLFIIISNATNFNTKTEMYVSSIFLLFSTLLVFTNFIVLNPRLQFRVWFLIPVAILMFSPVQYENALWGFQLGWYMVLFFSLLAIFLISVTNGRSVGFVMAVISGILASFSSLQGLLVWPLGCFLLIFGIKERRRSMIWFWCAAALITVIVYFIGFKFSNTGALSLFDILDHPIRSVLYFFAALGSYVPGGTAISIAVGVVTFTLAIMAVSMFIASKKRAKLVYPLILILYSILFALLLVAGRSDLGIGQAMSSRYTTFTLLLPMGLYLFSIATFRIHKDESKKQSVLLMNVVISVVIIAQVFIGVPVGIESGHNSYQRRIAGLHALQQYAIGNTTGLKSTITADIYPSYSYFLSGAQLMKRYRLGAFSSSNIS